MMKEILLQMFQNTEVGYDKEKDRFTGVVTLPDKVLDAALSAIKEELLRKLPWKKRQDNNGSIGFNDCLSKVQKIIEEACK